MTQPLVSIIIPTYNRAHIIGETLDSVLAQTYTNWECIVVDDGSTDTTAELLAEYCKKDGRFQFHHRPKDRPKGANACRNYGFEQSKGEYINWFDDDDLMMPDKLEIQLKELHNTTYDFAISQTMMFDVKNQKKIGLRSSKLISKNILEDYILFRVFWLIEAPLWKKNFLVKNNILFDETLVQRQDYDFHMRVLFISENYVANNNPLVIVKIHEERMSNSGIDKPEKIFSNAKVKNNILLKYRNKLTFETLKSTYKELIDLYKFSLRNKQYKNAIYIFRYLCLNIFIKKTNFLAKINFIFRLGLSYIVFYTFSKGDSFLNFK